MCFIYIIRFVAGIVFSFLTVLVIVDAFVDRDELLARVFMVPLLSGIAWICFRGLPRWIRLPRWLKAGFRPTPEAQRTLRALSNSLRQPLLSKEMLYRVGYSLSRHIKGLIGFIAVVAVISGIVTIPIALRGCEMAKIRSVTSRTVLEAGSEFTDAFFSFYADCFSSKRICGFKCSYNPSGKFLFLLGDFTAQPKRSDLGAAARWQVDNVLPEIIHAMGPRIKELQTIRMSNWIMDDFGKTASWDAELPLSGLSMEILEDKYSVRRYVQRNISVVHDTASGRYIQLKRRP